jgi:hypothetical protein
VGKIANDDMAGEQDSYLRIRVPEKLQKRFKAACTARGADMSKIVRSLLTACCEAADAGDPLIAPLTVSSRKPPQAKTARR